MKAYRSLASLISCFIDNDSRNLEDYQELFPMLKLMISHHTGTMPILINVDMAIKIITRMKDIKGQNITDNNKHVLDNNC
jgi:hypothetical protein